MDNKKAIVILGPTATGKSDVAIRLAEMLGGEVISADSMQVYTGMDIGTAKPSPEEMARIRHHLINVCSPDDAMTVARYCELAAKALDDITSRGKLPIVVGGTGLYIDAFTKGFLFSEAEADDVLRKKLYKRAEDEGIESLYVELMDVDPLAASKIHRNDLRRIVRALEVYGKSGKPISMLQEEGRARRGVRAAYFGLTADRSVIVSQIERRVDAMMAKGLLQEVRSLVSAGYGTCKVAMQAIGYKELIEHLNGKTALEEAVLKVKAETRKYSKRQMTWFKRNSDVIWFDAGKLTGEEIASGIAEELKERGF